MRTVITILLGAVVAIIAIAAALYYLDFLREAMEMGEKR
jgi:hypothetical protein